MKKINLITAILSASFIIACSGTDNKQQNDHELDTMQPDTTVHETDEHSDLDTADIAFLKHAAIGGLTEVESSAKILQLGTTQELKAFAEMMLKDHRAANDQLNLLAQMKGYDLPAGLPDDKLALVQKIASFKDDGKNEFYARLMLTEHQQALNLFSSARNSKDADIKKFASETLPKLEHHYSVIKDINTKLLQPKIGQGDDPLKLSDQKQGKSH